ncbi:MAG TPA: LCP family protein [Actinomycetota bacterium]|nr:LCP family protein [Actinomycetota bacterium]
MSARRKLLLFPVAGVIGALLWATLGSFQSAAGQTPATTIARAHAGEFAPSYTRPIFILMLGGDGRTGNSPNARSDSIHIVAIVPSTMHASILGIPRDSYVNIPGHGQNKINSAMFFGGPQLTIQTVEQLTGCHFDYYTLTSFQGFIGIVNDFGGITMKVTENTPPDHYSHYNFQQGVTYHLNGGTALAFARDRHTRPRGDFDRSLAQGKLIIAALAQQEANSRKDPGTLLRAMGAMYRNLRLDIPVTEALKLGLLALKIKPANVTNEVMTGGIGNVGGASIVTVPQAARNQFVDICSDGQLGN